MSRHAPNIVDAHVHLWDPKRLHYAWLNDLPPLRRTFLPSDLKTTASKLIFVECGCDASQNVAEVDWITELAKANPQLKGIIAHASLERGKTVRATLELLAARPLVKGVRRNLQGEPDDFLKKPGFREGLQALAEFGYTFDLCIRADQLPAAEELVRSTPQITFVLDHFGKPGVRENKFAAWASNLQSLAKLPNVVCKISGLTTEADWANWKTADLARYFDHAFASFGSQRVLFGSDWPVATLATTYDRWIETVLELAPCANDQQLTQLFQTNAERIYRV